MLGIRGGGIGGRGIPEAEESIGRPSGGRGIGGRPGGRISSSGGISGCLFGSSGTGLRGGIISTGGGNLGAMGGGGRIGSLFPIGPGSKFGGGIGPIGGPMRCSG